MTPQDRTRCLPTRWTGCSVFVLTGYSSADHRQPSQVPKTADEEDEDDPVNKMLEFRVKMALQPELADVLMSEAILAQDQSPANALPVCSLAKA